VTEVIANKRQVEFLRLDIQNATEPFYGFFVHQIAPDAVNGIGGVDDDAAFAQHLYHTIDLSRFRILRMDIQQFGCHGAAKVQLEREWWLSFPRPLSPRRVTAIARLEAISKITSSLRTQVKQSPILN
jgi:hypothetical protein